MDYKITFINHACMVIENEKHSIMIDPWFSGKVFNNSWSLLEDTDLSLIDFDKLSHIFISHEHPDHLHWDSLKKIKELTSNQERQIFVVSIRRKNKNIKKAIEKIGFKHAELVPSRRTKITDSLWVSQFPTGHDSAFVFEVGDVVVLNQNDCKLSPDQSFLIKQKFPKIDLWFMQFGLAGYYANRNDKQGLENARNSHIQMIKDYYDLYMPNCFVPFASYMYFCKKHNSFLNKWQVKPADLIDQLNIPTQFVFYGDEVLLHGYQKRNSYNLEKWSNIFNSKKEILEPKKINKSEIVSAFNNFVFENNYNTPESFFVELFDSDEKFFCDFKNKKYSFLKTSKKAIAITSMEELLFYIKFPWGADTLNITSCFDMYDREKFKNVLIWKDQLYKR